MQSLGIGSIGNSINFLFEELSKCACASWEAVSTAISKYVGEFFILLGIVFGCFFGVCICSCLSHFDDSGDHYAFGSQIDICQFVQDCIYSFFSRRAI